MPFRLPSIPAPHAKNGADFFYHPAFFTPVRIESIQRTGDDETDTARTIAIMARVIREDTAHPAVRRATAEATQGSPDRIAGIFGWIKRHVTLVTDPSLAEGIRGIATPEETEVLIRPADLLMMPAPAGDCDDFAMLSAAMLRAAGIPAQLVTIAADPAQPANYSHVYVLAHTPRGPVSLDTSHGPRPNWSARPIGKARIWDIDYMTVSTDRTGIGFAVTVPTTTTTWWQDLAKIGAQAGADIARIRATPGGFYQQTTPTGQTTFRQQAGAAGAFEFPSGQVGTAIVGATNLPLLIIGGVALVLVIMAVKR